MYFASQKNRFFFKKNNFYRIVEKETKREDAMAIELFNFYMSLFKAYGPELVGSLILAFSIGFFYNQSTIKGGLKALCYAFYVLAFKNIILMGYQVSPLVSAHFEYRINIYPSVVEWINLSLVCISTALFISSALQILRFIFSSFTCFL